MSGSESLQKCPVVYKSPDNINNFKVRVNLCEVHEGAENFRGETKVFSWQRKVYGKFEREFYKDPANCVTDLEKRYHEDVARSVHDDDVLFTYVHEDEFNVDEKYPAAIKRADLHKQLDELQLSDNAQKKPKGFDFKKSLIDSVSSPYGKLRDFEVMFVMADLGEYVGNTCIRSEYVLCKIQHDPRRKILIMDPDFSNFQPYELSTNGGGSRTFRYYIQDASERFPADALVRESDILNKIAGFGPKMKPGDFALPPSSKLQVHLFLEVLFGRDFEYNDIFIQYLVDLPEGWSCENADALKGVTPSGHSEKDDHLTYFGFPFEMLLEYDLRRSSGAPKAPYIFFEVISKDSWDRFRTEGLAYTLLPISRPGVYRYDLHCLRITPRGPSGNLRRFFVGDCSSCNDITWISIPKDYDRPTINKYGANTVGTGQIAIRMNVVHHSSVESSAEEPRGHKFVLEKLTMSSLVKSIDQVLQAFKQAKKRMVDARKSV